MALRGIVIAALIITTTLSGCSHVTDKPVAAEPQVTNKPSTAQPQVTNKPDTAQPQVTNKPSTAQPQVTNKPDTAQPQVTNKPSTAQPQVTNKPDTAQPQVTNKPSTAQPQVTNKPDTAQPQVTNKPSTAQPHVTNKPDTTQPQATVNSQLTDKPVSAKPKVTNKSGGNPSVSVQTPSSPDSLELLLVGKVIDISSAVHINTTFPEGLHKNGSAIYNNYSKIFQSALNKKYGHVGGFIGIIILGFTKGSIIARYKMKFNVNYFHRNASNFTVLNDTLSTLNKDWTEFETDIMKENITGNVDIQATEKELSQNDWNKITDECSIPGVCPAGYMCQKGTCKAICPSYYDCSKHGECVIDSDGKSPKCMCNVPYTGDKCEIKGAEQTNTFTSKDRQLIIEIASGAGGGVILFLLVILVCVCVQWRRSTTKVKKSDEKTLRETIDLKELGGKTNPIYDKDIESNVANTIIPSRRGSLERRSPDRRVSLERRSPDRRGSLESRPPPYATSDGSRGYNMESFGKPLDYDRDSERNFIRRDDGRLYHVIDDGEPSNQTLLYQPSRYQQSNGSMAQDHDQPRYTDYPRTHSVYDRIDTSREYKISRPNIGGRSRNYDY